MFACYYFTAILFQRCYCFDSDNERGGRLICYFEEGQAVVQRLIGSFNLEFDRVAAAGGKSLEPLCRVRPLDFRTLHDSTQS